MMASVAPLVPTSHRGWIATSGSCGRRSLSSALSLVVGWRTSSWWVADMKTPPTEASGFSGMQVRVIEGGRFIFEAKLNSALRDGWILLREFPVDLVWIEAESRRESLYSMMVFKMDDDVEPQEGDHPA